MIDHGDEYLSSDSDTYGQGIYYTQYDATTLYTIQHDAERTCDTIYIFDLQLLSYQPVAITIPVAVSDMTCMASSAEEQRLYLPGGYTWETSEWLDSVQVFDLETSQWLDNVPSMTYKRYRHGCIVVDSQLYVVGYVSAVEVIDIIDIQSNSWYILDDTVISSGLEYFGFAEAGGIIFVIGGGYVDRVYTIDTVSGTVSLSDESLPYKLGYVALVHVNGVLYGFGGADGSEQRADWISYEMPTTEPTTDPTTEPTAEPTPNGTEHGAGWISYVDIENTVHFVSLSIYCTVSMSITVLPLVIPRGYAAP